MARIRKESVDEIVANRVNLGREEYLIRWRLENAGRDVYSWHVLEHLKDHCLPLLQDYLSARRTSKKRKISSLNGTKTNGNGDKSIRPRSASQHKAPDTTSGRIESYGGEIYRVGSELKALPSKDVSQSKTVLPSASMKSTSGHSTVGAARILIKQAFEARLAAIRGPPISFVNAVDSSTPSLRFKFIERSRLGKDVFKLDDDTIVGCMKCRPHMGQNIGCEYTQKCDCLEFAAPVQGKLTEEQRRKLKRNRDTTGFSKRFPYHQNGLLDTFYLNERYPIYECNAKCMCGPICKNRLVQHGRKVKLEIFKTGNRGWGIRAKEALPRGHFIDTYRGEIITDAEATRREEVSLERKDSFLYTLDKFREREELRDMDLKFHVVDGEHMGGISRFMNHSCDPNCRQFTVSYNKHDWMIYELAFFTIRDIKVDEELTFDYLDKDDEDTSDSQEDDSINVSGASGQAIKELPRAQESQDSTADHEPVKCRCGSEYCRKWLWM